jgi:predicted HAD superfamily Cof-like phosphohydrolase
MFREAQNAVHDFHTAFRFPIPDSPHQLNKHRIELRAKWIEEELDELRKATTLVDQVDAAVDIIYFALGILVEAGVDGDTAFRHIHEANMSKLDAQGHPIYDEDGKVAKPANWTSPRQRIEEWLSNISAIPDE